MSPVSLHDPSSRYLSEAEREEIAIGLAEGLSYRAIGARIGRAASTVSREVALNGTSSPGTGQVRYRAVPAHAFAEAAARRPKVPKLVALPVLGAYVEARLVRLWSPEQISHQLTVDFPDDESMRISHEAIYQSLYVQGRGGLRRELTVCLRTGRALRKPARRASQRRTRAHIPPELLISERPAEVEDRAVPGHWEGDLITGAGNKTAIGTLVERSTRFTMLLHLPERHTAEAVHDAILDAITGLPEALRRSLTWDQGVELAEHAKITFATNLAIYFCDPHSPWQRGTNENTNGLLRQYFPKGTDLSVHGPAELARVAAELNSRPRETLDWKTPAQALTELLSSSAF